MGIIEILLVTYHCLTVGAMSVSIWVKYHDNTSVSVAQLDARPRLRVRPPPGRQHSFVKIDHEIYSTID